MRVPKVGATTHRCVSRQMWVKHERSVDVIFKEERELLAWCLSRREVLTWFLNNRREMLTWCSPRENCWQVLESFLKLSDWESVMEWQEQLSKWRSEVGLTSLQSAFNSSVDVNYIKSVGWALSRFFFPFSMSSNMCVCITVCWPLSFWPLLPVLWRNRGMLGGGGVLSLWEWW